MVTGFPRASRVPAAGSWETTRPARTLRSGSERSRTSKPARASAWPAAVIRWPSTDGTTATARCLVAAVTPPATSTVSAITTASTNLRRCQDRPAPRTGPPAGPLPGQERPGCPLAGRLPTFAGRLPTRLVLQWLAVRRLAVRRLVGGRRWLAVRVGLGVAVGGGLPGDRGRAVVAGLAAAAEGRVPAAHDREPPAGGRLRVIGPGALGKPRAGHQRLAPERARARRPGPGNLRHRPGHQLLHGVGHVLGQRRRGAAPVGERERDRVLAGSAGRQATCSGER